METLNAAESGTFEIGGDLPVYRLGFGAMRITGDGVWGPPKDKKECIAVLKRTGENIAFIPWFPLATGNWRRREAR